MNDFKPVPGMGAFGPFSDLELRLVCFRVWGDSAVLFDYTTSLMPAAAVRPLPTALVFSWIFFICLVLFFTALTGDTLKRNAPFFFDFRFTGDDVAIIIYLCK